MTSGRVLVSQWPYYLHIAREERDECRRVMVANLHALPASSITSIVMSALAVEAFINEIAEAADMARLGSEGIVSAAMDQLQDLANALKKAENDRESISNKYQMAYLILSGHSFPRGRPPFQEFKRLADLRDLLVHPKPGDRHSKTGHVEPKEALIRDFQQKGYTRTRGRKVGDPQGGVSWLQEIQTVQMADWAHGAARAIIAAVGGVLPADPPRTGGIDMLKQSTQNIPL